MQMTESEVLRNIFDAADQKAQIKICAQLNAVPEDDIKEILKKNGVDLRKLKTEKKKNIHGIKQKPHKTPYKKPEIIPCPPANADITVAQACATLIARVAELAKQKKAIEKELEEIGAQIERVSDGIVEALLSLPEVSK